MTVDNIVKMWHSIERAWDLMEAHVQREGIQYTRVAMLRSDVVYMTPIDIWETERMGVRDRTNNVAVIPGTFFAPLFYKTRHERLDLFIC